MLPDGAMDDPCTESPVSCTEPAADQLQGLAGPHMGSHAPAVLSAQKELLEDVRLQRAVTVQAAVQQHWHRYGIIAEDCACGQELHLSRERGVVGPASGVAPRRAGRRHGAAQAVRGLVQARACRQIAALRQSTWQHTAHDTALHGHECCALAGPVVGAQHVRRCMTGRRQALRQVRGCAP